MIFSKIVKSTSLICQPIGVLEVENLNLFEKGAKDEINPRLVVGFLLLRGLL
jgi:hypothetical protein